MTRLIPFSLILILTSFLYAQEGFHQHDGFYLSMAVGPVFGNIYQEKSLETITISGTGGLLDLKLGWALKDNIILHVAYVNSTLSGPIVKHSNGSTHKTPNSLGFGEGMLGMGVTNYHLPYNCFASGTFGIGNYASIDTQYGYSYGTDPGFSMQLKLGKEWWVGKNWGIGIAATYGKTVVTDETSKDIIDHLNSNRFGILFNTTFN
jgi:hypothetical protein